VGGYAIVPSDPVKAGYNFRGWFDSKGSIFSFDITPVTSDIKLTARWSAASKMYTITFDSNEGTEVTAQSVMEGSKVTKPEDPKKDNCYFWAWYKNVEDIDSFDFDNETVTSDMTLYALYVEEVAIYGVDFDSDGGTLVESQIIAEGYKATRPDDPTKAGYEFVGWYKGEELFDFDTEIKDNITLKAKWNTANKLTVTFNTNGGSDIPSEKVEEGSAVAKPANPQREGYEFDNWVTKDGIVFDFATTINSDITLYATWKNVSDEFTVKFKVDGSDYHTETVKKWSKVPKPADPSKEGSHFVYWMKSDGTEFVFDNELIYQNTTLSAKWDAEEYFTVTFNTDGGTVAYPQRIKKGDKATDPKPTKEGYIVSGWVDEDNNDFNFNMAITRDIKLTAKWVYKSYQVAYVAEGNVIFVNSVNANGIAVRPANPVSSEKYMSFSYWSLEKGGKTKFDFTKPITANITLYAVWKGYEVGDTGPSGGYIVYDCDAYNDSGNADKLNSSECGWRFLEAAKEDLSSTVIFGVYSENHTYGTKYDIGTGKKNTEILLKNRNKTYKPLSDYVWDKEIDGYSDWFVPSRDELNLLYVNLYMKGLGNFKADNYWTSSEYFANGESDYYKAYSQDFKNGRQNGQQRDQYDYVRPVRYF